LGLSQNEIRMIQGLNHLGELHTLHLGENHITKIVGLEQLGKLQRVSLDRNQITRVEGISGLRHLKLVDLVGNDIREPPESLPKYVTIEPDHRRRLLAHLAKNQIDNDNTYRDRD